MRIVAGKHRSRVLKTLEGINTRPTSDRVKEAIFSSLGSSYLDSDVLDLFGGSGNIGLEAISRGANRAVICDASKDAIKVIQHNVNLLKEEEHVEVLTQDYKQALVSLSDRAFGFIYIDPPYTLEVYEEILMFISESKMLGKGYVVVECKKQTMLKETYGSLVLVKEKQYGITKVYFYKQ